MNYIKIAKKAASIQISELKKVNKINVQIIIINCSKESKQSPKHSFCIISWGQILGFLPSRLDGAHPCQNFDRLRINCFNMRSVTPNQVRPKWS